MERPDYSHKSPEENINILFNMVQKCRVDVTIMRGRKEYKGKKDADLVKSAEALAREVRQLFGEEV